MGGEPAPVVEEKKGKLKRKAKKIRMTEQSSVVKEGGWSG